MTAPPQDVVADLMRENARLQAELRAARDRQNASAEVLRAVANTSGDAEQSLRQIAEITAGLFGTSSVTLSIAGGDEWSHTIRVGASSQRIGSEVPAAQLRIGARNLPGTVFRENRQIHIPDLDNLDPAIADWPTWPHARAAGARAMAGTPLRREGKAIGVLNVHRDRPVPFTAEELALLQSFADQAAIVIENARLFNETREALERQTATSEILKVIASSPSDVQPVFDVIVERAVRLCGGRMGRVYRYDGSVIQMVAAHGLSVPGLSKVQQVFPRPATDDTIAGQVMLSRQPYFVTDIKHNESVPGLSRQMIEAMGTRSQVTVPMLRSGESIGAITVGWADPDAYGEQQITLLQTFADQAVIAIENVRLFNETREALERQTATAEILKVIARSPSDVQPVFEAIAESAKRVLGSHMAVVTRVIDGVVHLASRAAGSKAEIEALEGPLPYPLSSPRIHSKVARTGELSFRTDMETDPDVPQSIKEHARGLGYRSLLVVPMLRNGVAIGTIGIARREPGPFADKAVNLLRTFADQAVIAIENARLFDEVQTKTRDLTEALTYQTGSSNILSVIASSPTDVAPVLKAIVESACELCEAYDATVLLKDGGNLRFSAHHGPIPLTLDKWPINRDWTAGRAFLDQRPVHVHDLLSPEGDDFPDGREMSHRWGHRSVLSVPLLREGESVGTIALRRTEAHPFNDKQIALLQTFADQAVIAIGNVRLFDEVQAKTRDLTEALTYQTGSSNILGVIASSPTDVGPVLKAIVESACELCEADDALVVLKDGDDLVFREQHGTIPVVWKRQPISRDWAAGRAVVDRRPIHVHDLLSPEGEQFPDARRFAHSTGVRTVLSVPLLRENESIGSIVLRRTDVQPFSDKQVALLQTFADQAVIAIGNVRLFDEVQAKTRDLTEALTYQTGSSNILSVIASSPTDVGPVLKAIVESACELCEADDALVVLKDGDDLRTAAHQGPIPVGLEKRPISRSYASGRAVIDKIPVHLHDVLSAEGAEFPEAQEMSRPVGIRTLLGVPLLRENESIGTILLRRTAVNPFSDKQIALLKTFANQAVIAIGNVRLFEQVQERTRELSRSLDELRIAQDRLVQTEKLASLGQLTAGIAHEIKNPLNFVNNFAALSAELTDELNGVLLPAALDDRTRGEIEEITHTLKENLAKVVQHGKRADSIVKNMLLHSREGSGDHRLADINALLDESLNLAYHGARAEKREFNVTLQRNFDEMAGNIEVFPQEITRVFLNLISNGFYAVTKRKSENGGSGFEPTVGATTKNLGDAVEIRIRDNGTGIAAEVRQKMFNPFFTTKPAGEGTGLGLSMSHDIIVKQHGGSIDVETEPGRFTEFRIVLPRTSNLSKPNQQN